MLVHAHGVARGNGRYRPREHLPGGGGALRMDALGRRQRDRVVHGRRAAPRGRDRDPQDRPPRDRPGDGCERRLHVRGAQRRDRGARDRGPG